MQGKTEATAAGGRTLFLFPISDLVLFWRPRAWSTFYLGAGRCSCSEISSACFDFPRISRWTTISTTSDLACCAYSTATHGLIQRSTATAKNTNKPTKKRAGDVSPWLHQATHPKIDTALRIHLYEYISRYIGVRRIAVLNHHGAVYRREVPQLPQWLLVYAATLGGYAKQNDLPQQSLQRLHHR